MKRYPKKTLQNWILKFLWDSARLSWRSKIEHTILVHHKKCTSKRNVIFESTIWEFKLKQLEVNKKTNKVNKQNFILYRSTKWCLDLLLSTISVNGWITWLLHKVLLLLMWKAFFQQKQQKIGGFLIYPKKANLPTTKDSTSMKNFVGHLWWMSDMGKLWIFC